MERLVLKSRIWLSHDLASAKMTWLVTFAKKEMGYGFLVVAEKRVARAAVVLEVVASVLLALDDVVVPGLLASGTPLYALHAESNVAGNVWVP